MQKFDLPRARLLVDLAIEAYKDEDHMGLNEYDYDLRYYISDDKTDTQAYIATKGNDAVIGFRGTESFTDMLTDLRITKRNFPSMRRWFFKSKVHKGFLSSFISVQRQIRSLVKEIMNQEALRITTTGHSLGGALATISALDLTKSLKQDVEVYSYGAPMVGNRWFVRHFNSKVKHSWRIVNDDDVVPQFPGGGYHHVDTYVLIDEEERIIINPSAVERLEKNIEGWASVIEKGATEHRSGYYKDLLNRVDDVLYQR